jgi:hypothetical protein
VEGTEGGFTVPIHIVAAKRLQAGLGKTTLGSSVGQMGFGYDIETQERRAVWD